MKSKIKITLLLVLAHLVAILIIVSLGLLGKYLKSIDFNLLGNFCLLLIPIVTLYGVIIFNKKVNKVKPYEYGFHFQGILKNSFIGIGFSLCILTMVLLISSTVLDIHLEHIPLKESFFKQLILVVITNLAIAFWEEVFFRGLVFNTCYENKFGFHKSAFISALLFSLVHWSSFDMNTTSWFWYLGIVFMGYLLVVIYKWTNSIWSAVCFHFTWNFIVDFFDSSQNKIGLFQITDFSKVSKSLDNIETIVLGIVLLLVLFLLNKKEKRLSFYDK